MNILIDGQTFETPEIHRGIGVYTKNVINNMLKLNYEHIWYICVSDDKNISELDPWVQNKLHIIKRAEVKPEINYAKNKEYTIALQKIVYEEQIDLVWIPNMLMVNVLALENMLTCRVCITVYDIIPYLFPVKEWGDPIVEEYRRRLKFLAQNDVELLFISKASQDDYVNNIIGINRSQVTPLAADARSFYKKRSTSDKVSHTILFTGGFDYRKNIDGAIAAFEHALMKHRDDEEFAKCKLIIVGAADANTQQKYEEIFLKRKLKGKVNLTGYISEKELADLYKKADVFFFPSLYEGFGLPILEAMLGGGYVVSADNSSLPEVCGGHALLCNADKIDEMAEALYQGFYNSMIETVAEKNKRQEYALNYSWEKTSQKMLDFWEKGDVLTIQKEKSSIAILTPWPEQETGIANFQYKLVPYLQKYYMVDIFTDALKHNCKKYNNIGFYGIEDFVKLKGKYKHVLYEVGNNVDFHKEIFEQLESHKGVAEIHDYILTPFFFHAYFLKGNKGKFKEELKTGYGDAGVKEFHNCERSLRQPDMNLFPMSHTVAKCANKVILHNHWSVEQLGVKNARVIPLPCFDKEQFEKDEMQKLISQIKANYKVEKEIIIGCFGWVNANKRPQIIIKAINELIQLNYDVKLFFWGKAADNIVSNLAKEMNIQDSVCISGYLNREEYAAALNMTDIVINLRYPSMGESSGTLCEAFKYGKAVIVSDLNQYKEFPDEVCWKVPICDQEQALLTEYLKCLIEKKDVRAALGNNAKCYAENALNPERIAAQYYNFLEKTNEKKR